MYQAYFFSSLSLPLLSPEKKPPDGRLFLTCLTILQLGHKYLIFPTNFFVFVFVFFVFFLLLFFFGGGGGSPNDTKESAFDSISLQFHLESHLGCSQSLIGSTLIHLSLHFH